MPASSRDLQILDEIWEKIVRQIGYRPTAPLSSMVQSEAGGRLLSDLATYVAAGGNDTADGLSVGRALLTPAAAIALVPKTLSYSALVNVGAGTFSGASISGFVGGTDGAGFYLHGTYSKVTPASGVSTGTAGAGTSSTTLLKPTAASNWTASDLVGSFLRILSGGGSSASVYAPIIRPIKANSTTSITVDSIPGMDSTTVFEIVTPATLLGAIDSTNDSCISVSNCAAPITIRGLKFTGTLLNYLVKALDCQGSVVTFEGCTFSTSAVIMEVLAARCGGFVVKNCVFSAGTGASISASSNVTCSNIWMNAAGTLTISDSQVVTVRGLDSTAALSRVLGAIRVGSMTAEITANNGGATPAYFEDVASFTAAGANLLRGTGNTGYGLEIAKTGRYTLTGSTITGGTGDILFLGNPANWAQLSSSNFGIISEHSSSAVANSAYTKALVYGNRTFVGNVDVSGRLLNYGYFNTAGNLTVPTLTGTQALDMETGQINGVDGGLNGNPRGTLEVICSSVTATVTLPSNFTINGGWCCIVNRGGSALKVLPPSPGTINGTTFYTLAAGSAKIFVSLNGNGGKDFWVVG